ncbi:hypothetical protein WJX81_005877 [Elliptochloris bilobata]|uniref:Uncharacterized protein n=1 Tax=Elliptochloris bilobata TaxID=381761 RepID=A0AAW1QV26_9CHLO
MVQALPRALPPLPHSLEGMDRAYLAGASPFSKVSAAARRKREFRDAGFRGGCDTRAARRTQEAAADSSEASPSGLGGLVNELLYGAASSLDRGQATCRACKGTGTLECSACQGTGVLQPKKVRMNQLRHAVNR